MAFQFIKNIRAALNEVRKSKPKKTYISTPPNQQLEGKKSTNYQEHYDELVKLWLSKDYQVEVGSVEAVSILYSGQRNTNNNFNYLSNLKWLKRGMWLSEQVIYALGYTNTKDNSELRKVFKLSNLNPIPVLKFREGAPHPSGTAHLGEFITLEAKSIQRDIFLSEHWDNILKTLVNKYPKFSEVRGHERGLKQSKMTTSELWLSNLDDVDFLKECVIDKENNDSYIKEYGKDETVIDTLLFNLEVNVLTLKEARSENATRDKVEEIIEKVKLDAKGKLTGLELITKGLKELSKQGITPNSEQLELIKNQTNLSWEQRLLHYSSPLLEGSFELVKKQIPPYDNIK